MRFLHDDATTGIGCLSCVLSTGGLGSVNFWSGKHLELCCDMLNSIPGY